MPDLPLQLPTVPEGFCNALNDSDWVQTLMNLIAKGVAKFEGSGFTVLINSETQPGVTDRDKLWRRPSVAGWGLFEFSGGAWIIKHPEVPSGSARRWWEGTEADSWAYDGGDGTDPALNPPTTNNGAMWEVDHNYDGRSPMGAGSINAANPAKVLTVSENYGDGTVTVDVGTDTGLSDHVHVFGRMTFVYDNDDYRFVTGLVTGATLTGPSIQGAGGAGANPAAPLQGSGDTGPYLNTGPAVKSDGTSITNQVNIQVVHPVRGGYMLKRTARENYVGS